MNLGPTYKLDLSKLVHIWFSTNENECLPAINKLRLIRKSLQNPKVKFSLVYSSECLSHGAQRDLESFAQSLNITLVDFDTDIEQLDKSNLDQQLYILAKKEIASAKAKTGGNMASASDCARLLTCVLAKYGNYVDFDVDIDFSECKRFHQVKFPVILPAGNVPVQQTLMPTLCNHFLGAAIDPTDATRLHPDAIKRLDNVKSKIISFYKGENPLVLLTEFGGLPNQKALNKQLAEFIYSLYSKCAFDIIKYRHAIIQIDVPENIRESLIRDSVMQITGPMAWFHLFPEIMAGFNDISLEKPQSLAKVGPLLKQLSVEVVKCGYSTNKLGTCIISKDTPGNLEDIVPQNRNVEDVIGVKCDQSWTPYGAEVLKQKSTKIDESVSTIQAACRDYLARLKLNKQ